jgi:hypothetical protein
MPVAQNVRMPCQEVFHIAPVLHITPSQVDGARGILNKLLADVYIFTDALSGMSDELDVARVLC